MAEEAQTQNPIASIPDATEEAQKEQTSMMNLRRRVVDLDQLAREMTTPLPPAPPPTPELEADVTRFAPKTPLPNYVQHAEDTPLVGKLTAEAAVRDYDAAGKAIEAMGQELIALQKRTEEEVQNIHNVITLVKEVADRYRAEGKAIFERIEANAQQTQKVRELCTEMRMQLEQLGK